MSFLFWKERKEEMSRKKNPQPLLTYFKKNPIYSQRIRVVSLLRTICEMKTCNVVLGLIWAFFSSHSRCTWRVEVTCPSMVVVLPVSTTVRDLHALHQRKIPVGLHSTCVERISRTRNRLFIFCGRWDFGTCTRIWSTHLCKTQWSPCLLLQPDEV